MTSACSIEGCGRVVYGHGWCAMHYQRWYKYGDPLTMRRAPDGSGHVCKTNGYKLIRINGKDEREHVAIAEKALGKPLPPGAEVHHIDGNRANNDPSNLVICPDRAYHTLLHMRQRAIAAGARPEWRKCWICQTYDALENLQICLSSRSAEHNACRRQYALRKFHERKEKRRVSV